MLSLTIVDNPRKSENGLILTRIWGGRRNKLPFVFSHVAVKYFILLRFPSRDKPTHVKVTGFRNTEYRKEFTFFIYRFFMTKIGK